jgi:aryl-alcohol dehydrogenase-like predicted oxidoreductase
MKYLTLPDTDLTVSRFCYGTGAFGTAVNDDRADRLLAAFVEAGGNFFDTAHCYAFWEPNGLGASERELGASLRRIGAWEKAVIATKGGHPDGGPDYPRPADFLSERVVHSDIEESLNRLGADCIDLFYLHRDDGRTEVSDIIEILNREVEQGRVNALGASNWSVRRMAEANAYASQRGLRGFVVSQVQWSLSEPDWAAGPDDPTMRTVGTEEIEWHAGAGIPIAAYSATGNGFFGKDGATSNPTNRTRWERVQTISATLGCTPTQLALAWLLHQKPTVIPVFSTANLSHLTEILAADRVALDTENLARLTAPPI